MSALLVKRITTDLGCTGRSGVSESQSDLLAWVDYFISKTLQGKHSEPRTDLAREDREEDIDILIKTVLTVKGRPFLSTLDLSKLSSIPYKVETFRSSSPIMGNSRLPPARLSTSLTHPWCESTLLAERPMSWVSAVFAVR
jgi:hypothetical protein